MDERLELWDYRRRVAAIYQRAREGTGRPAWETWRADRDDLFRTHPQTPLDHPADFDGLDYFPHDERWRTEARFTPETPAPWGEFSRIGALDFTLEGVESHLPVFWLEAYGGGIFVPFKDATNGVSTYGGGRYILDTVKGADLGHDGDLVVLDFNYAYHPSCVHSPRWVCPLAPADSRIDLAIEAGERL